MPKANKGFSILAIRTLRLPPKGHCCNILVSNGFAIFRFLFYFLLSHLYKVLPFLFCCLLHRSTLVRDEAALFPRRVWLSQLLLGAIDACSVHIVSIWLIVLFNTFCLQVRYGYRKISFFLPPYQKPNRVSHFHTIDFDGISLSW